ncbi:MAG TPA: nucleotidyltransferase family protein [Longimicrobiaceae bacterium]|nr:nucleotidyltransferase family protein [Longimicrobiaceae bacterium]
MRAEPRKAVILARGLGTRMRRADAAAALAPEQAAAADTGIKAMIPVGRPFLDYVLSALAGAGFREACLVVAPEHDAIRDHYDRLAPTRIGIRYAVQAEPLGTADAVLAAEDFAAGEPFVVLNSDNYYPVSVLERLRRLGEPGLPAFGRDALSRGGNVRPERIRAFALLEIDSGGYLRRIVEKPDEAAARALGTGAYVSMNCWSFAPAIFRACREVGPSPRGELELPLAVQHAIDRGEMRMRAFPVEAPVLDLSHRADVPAVAAALAGVEVAL